MNVESTRSTTEIPDETRNEREVGPIDDLAQLGVGKVRHYHDVQASLAIINGYSQALKSSFDELKDQYVEVLEHKEEDLDTTGSDRLMSLEADCRFCLSRLCSSIDQLKQRLEVGGVLRDSTPD